MGNKSSRNSKLTVGSDVLQSLFENGKSPLSEQFTRWKLWAHWRDIAGPTIAENSEPVWFDHGVLYLWVKHSTWVQQLMFMVVPLRTEINKYLGRQFVKSIKFTLDRRAVPMNGATDTEELKRTVERMG